MKTGRWTKQEKQYLLNNFSQKTYRDIANHLGRSVSSVLAQSQALDIQGKKQDRTWSEQEVETLKTLHTSHTISQLSELFGRSKSAIRVKMFYLNLKPFYKPKSQGGKVKKYLVVKVEDLELIEKAYGSIRNLITTQADILRKASK